MNAEFGLYEDTNGHMDVVELQNIATSHKSKQPEIFRFKELPLELRLEIWKMAMPGRRIFEPDITLRLPRARHQHNPEDPPLVRLKWKHPPPALRAVCRESRQASDMVGGFKFGRVGNTRQGCWFNYDNDVVFIDPNMMDNVHHMDLRCVSSLGFVHFEFKTEQGCREVLEIAVQDSSDCRTVIFYFDQESYPTIGTAKFDRLSDSDLVGNYEFSGRFGLPTGVANWGHLRQAVYNIWDEHLIQLGLDKALMPSLVGLDVVG